MEVKPTLWRWFNTSIWKKYVKLLDNITAFAIKHINEVFKNLESGDPKKRVEEQLSILETLLIKDKKIAFALVYDMLLTGVDTTARVTAAALYYLATNKSVQDKLREETMRLLPTPETPITKSVLDEMAYLKAVLKETMRLAPVVIGTFRKTRKNLVLSGYQIPKGTNVTHAHMLLSRLEKYFPQADKFIPDRWLRKDGEEYMSTDAHPFVYMPFGFGPRSCIGRRLANLEMEILIVKVVRNFEISWPHEEMKWTLDMFYGVASPLKYRMTPLN